MKIHKNILVILLLVTSAVCYAQNKTSVKFRETKDSLNFFFRVSSSTLQKDYRTNTQRLEKLDLLLSDPTSLSQIDSINIYATTSVEGSIAYNTKLATNRVKALKRHIIQKYPHTQISGLFNTSSYLCKWEDLRILVEADLNVPYRDEVLESIDSDRTHNEKEWRLRLMRNGIPWIYIKAHLLPQQRNGVSFTFFKEGRQIGLKRESMPQLEQLTIFETQIVQQSKPIFTHTPPSPKKKETHPLFAIKTNLLHAGLTQTPNLAGELGLGRKTTLDISGGYNWFNLDGKPGNNKKKVQWLVSPEFRYFTDKRFDGHFFGVFAMGGMYNIGNHELPFLFGKDSENYRYEGHTVGGGLSYGYQLLLSKHWSLEFMIGLGYQYLKHDIYEYPRCGRAIELGAEKHYFGPTKAGISIMFMIFNK